MHTDSKRSPAFWFSLIAGAVITNFISLSAHVCMLQGFSVPFPVRSSVPPTAVLGNTALAIFALLTFYGLARKRMAGRSLWVRALIVAALFAGLKELLRGGLMNAVVTTAWTFSGAQLLSSTLYSLVLGMVVVSVTPKLPSASIRAVAAVAIAAVMMFAVRPFTDVVLAPLLESLARFNHTDVYSFPYGWHVLSWAYATYFEPVIASIVVAALVWPALIGSTLTRAVQVTGLIVLIKGALLPTFLFSLWNPAGVGHGMVSESQFLLEALLLGILAAVTWRVAARSRGGLPGSGLAHVAPAIT